MYHEEIARLTARIVEAERPEKVILFGSYAAERLPKRATSICW